MLGAAAASAGAEQPAMPLPSSNALCLFETPSQQDRRTFLNLGAVQYIEMRSDELRIYYGGGNLGSGHELRIPVRSSEEARTYLQRMQATATQCAKK